MAKFIYHLAVFVAAAAQIVHAHTSLDSQYRIDVHSHPVPQIWLDALIEEGYPTVNGSLIVEGFPVPDWTLAGHLQNMDSYGVNYSTLSVTTPGVYFLASKPQKAKGLARELNNLLHNYTQTYPTRLGALCLRLCPMSRTRWRRSRYHPSPYQSNVYVRTSHRPEDSTASTPSTSTASASTSVYTGPPGMSGQGAGSDDGGVYRPSRSSRASVESWTATALSRHLGFPRSVTTTSSVSVT